jgi:hypothetical protein
MVRTSRRWPPGRRVRLHDTWRRSAPGATGRSSACSGSPAKGSVAITSLTSSTPTPTWRPTRDTFAFHQVCPIAGARRCRSPELRGGPTLTQDASDRGRSRSKPSTNTSPSKRPPLMKQIT